MPFATVIKRDGWFKLLPPHNAGLPSNVDYYFREYDALRGFADACGWRLRWKK